MKRILFAALLVASATGAYAIPVLTPIPTTAVGTAGGVTGWGYDITNPGSVDWVVLNDSFVTGGLSTGTFGTYVDYIASNFIVIGPNGDSGAVAFNRTTMAGLGEFDLKQFVPPFTHITGSINIDYSLFSQNPNDPNFDPGSFVGSGTFSAPAGVLTTPEPGSALLMGLPLVAFLWRRLRTGTSTQTATFSGHKTWT